LSGLLLFGKSELFSIVVANLFLGGGIPLRKLAAKLRTLLIGYWSALTLQARGIGGESFDWRSACFRRANP